MSKRNFTIRLRRGVRTARVTYVGRRARTVFRGGRLRARIDLRGLGKQRVTVRAVGRTRSGRVVREIRVFRNVHLAARSWVRLGQRQAS